MGNIHIEQINNMRLMFQKYINIHLILQELRKTTSDEERSNVGIKSVVSLFPSCPRPRCCFEDNHMIGEVTQDGYTKEI